MQSSAYFSKNEIPQLIPFRLLYKRDEKSYSQKIILMVSAWFGVNIKQEIVNLLIIKPFSFRAFLKTVS